MNQILPSVCPLDCPDTCSLSITVKDDQIIDVRGSDANPFTNGVVCKKVTASYPEMIHSANRLTTPLKRTGPRGSGSYASISWHEAIDLVHDGFSKAITTHGRQSVMPFNYAGPHGELAGASMDRRFFYKLGATLLDRGPLCGGVRGAAYASMFGGAPGMPPEQAVHADLIVVWCNNVTISNLHLARIIKKARKNGAKLIVVDPKRTKIAEQADLHLPIRPGSDVVFAMASAAEMERRKGLDMDFINNWTSGFDAYMDQARQYTLADVEKHCQLNGEQFNAFIDLYLQAGNVAVNIGNGIERGHSGGSGLRAAMALQALTGNHGRIGAGVVAKSNLATPKTPDRLQRPDLVWSRTRTFNIVDIAKLLLDETLDPPIMATMIYNHNPIGTHPDQANMIKALSREDLFIAGSDLVMTDSMKYCDVILPAASHFECHDIYGAYGQNYLQRAEPVISRVGQSLPNTEIFRRLAARFGFDEPMFKDTDRQLIDQALDGDSARLQGFAPSDIPLDRALQMTADNGAELIMCDTVTPDTPSGKIELFSQDMESRFGYGVPRFDEVPAELPFMLVTPSSKDRANTTFGGCTNSHGIQELEMNPADARAKGLSSGDKVLVSNKRGKVGFKLLVTDTVRPGILYSPKGAWLASSPTGQTANALIAGDLRTDIADGACYNDTYVDVSPE
jgi:anaerobic selenocysteine-containing dehydrogenase